MNRKVLALAALVATVSLGLAGCGSASGSSDETGNIITAYNSEPQNGLIPGDTNESGGISVITELFAGLVSTDTNGNVHNEVAQSITPNADASAYTITLKKGWKFTDGTDVTAQSFTKAWSYTANAKNAQKNASYFSEIQGYDDLQNADKLTGSEQLSGLKVIDDYTFTVALTQSDSVFPVEVEDSTFSPLPECFYKDPDAFGESPVGDGPYKFDSWTHDSQIKVVKNTDYHGNRVAKNDGLIFKVYTNTDSAYSDVQAGNLDVMNTVPASATRSFETDTSLQAYNKPGSLFYGFTIPSDMKHWETNTKEGQLRRQAISMTIDRQALASKLFNGVVTAATDFIPSVISGHSDDLKGSSNLSYNPKKAQELWKEAEAISHYDGTLTFTYNSDSADSKDVYEAVVNCINNTLHIGAKTSPIPTFQDFREDVTDRKIDGAFRNGWQPDYPSAEDYLYPMYDSQAADGNGSNDGDYKNAQVDELINKALASNSTTAQNSYYQQAEEILLQQLPTVPLYYGNSYGVAALGVHGFTIDWAGVPVYNEMTKA